MNGNSIALDTSAAIRLLNEADPSGPPAHSLESVFLPAVVVGELLFGALHSSRRDDNVHRVESLVSACQTPLIDQVTSRFYAEVRLRLKLKGRPIPENDIWIAAVCLQHNLPLASHDEHFAHIDGLQVESL